VHKERIGQTDFTFRKAGGEDLEDIYRLRYQVYCNECGFLSEDDFPDQTERDKFDDYSRHFLAEDLNGLVGTVRLVKDNPNGFPMDAHCKKVIDCNISDIDKKKIVEVSRLVISKRYRRRRDDGLYYTRDYGDTIDFKPTDTIKRIKPMAFGLYREVYQYCKRNDITHWLALMEKTLWLLLRMHNFVFQPIGETVNVYGPVRPYINKIEDTERLVAQRSPQMLKYFLDGLEKELIPPHLLEFIKK
jgi:N-acyl amino acid synthase of PEP-CTERM/exosortase system